jgi:hypothetical protein
MDDTWGVVLVRNSAKPQIALVRHPGVSICAHVCVRWVVCAQSVCPFFKGTHAGTSDERLLTHCVDLPGLLNRIFIAARRFGCNSSARETRRSVVVCFC